MPAGKGHHPFPYHIPLSNYPCFQEGGQEPLTASKKRGLSQPHSQALVPKGAHEPLRVHIPTWSSHGALPPGFGARRLAQGKASELGLENKAVSKESLIKVEKSISSLSFNELEVVGCFCTLVSVPPAFHVWLEASTVGAAPGSQELRQG